MKVEFKGRLRTEYIDGESECLIDQNHKTAFKAVINDHKVIVFPNRFKTNFASTGILRGIFPPRGNGRRKRYGKAAVLHDYLYETGEFCKDISDDIFYYAMKCSGVCFHIRLIMYLGVRIGGWYAWNKCRKNDQKDSKN